MLRRYSDAWFAPPSAARPVTRQRGSRGAAVAWCPVRWYAGTFTLDGRRLRLPVARGCPPLAVRLDRDPPYPAEQVRSVTRAVRGGPVVTDVTAEVPSPRIQNGEVRIRAGSPGSTLGHPPVCRRRTGRASCCSCRGGRSAPSAVSTSTTPRPARRAVARRAPKPGQRGSRRWRQHRRTPACRRGPAPSSGAASPARSAKTVIGWAVARTVSDAGRRPPARRPQPRRRATAQPACPRLADRALHTRPARQGQAARITVTLTDERGTSSTCPSCARRVPKPAGRVFSCPHCGQAWHRDLIAAVNIAARAAAASSPPRRRGITHRRAGSHLPGVHPARRDPRRRSHRGPPHGPWPAPACPASPARRFRSRSPTSRSLYTPIYQVH